MPAAPSTAANRPPNSPLATSASLIRESTHRRARFTGPVRRNGSWASPVAMEAFEHRLPKDHPLRSLFLADRPVQGDGGPGVKEAKPEWTYNMLLKHGVRSCLEYARSFDLKRAHAVSNPKLSPHLEFVDMGGHGYATVRLTGDEMRTEFVCIPRPITRSDRPDGGPLRYRVVHTASLWKPGERPVLRQQVMEGDPGLSI